MNSKEETEVLPEHWEMRVDTRTGMPYYLNHLKQFTTWDDPRVVCNPRGMLNNMGTMTRRSLSPAPTATRGRIDENGSTHIPFNHLLTPAQLNSDQFTQSLPRRSQRLNKPPIGRSIMDDDRWFRTGFDEPDDSFFNDQSWPINSLRMRSQSPFAAEQARHSPSRRISPGRVASPRPNAVTIPITTESTAAAKDAAETSNSDEEHVIIPTQYKQEPDCADVKRMRDSPRPKLSKQDSPDAEYADDSEAGATDETKHSVLHHTTSVYDNVSDNSNEENQPPEGNVNEDEQTEEEPLKSVSEVSDHKDDAAVSPGGDSDGEEEGEAEECDVKRHIEASYSGIAKVLKRVDDYKKDVDAFNGNRRSKEFRYLEEMLTRCQLALDNVDAFGDVDLRQHRKETVNHIDSLLQQLENQCQEH